MTSLVLGRIDIGQIFGILLLVISVLSWFVNVIQGNTPDGRQRPPKAKPKPQSSQSEIEVLLQELSSHKPKPQPPKSPPSKSQAERSESPQSKSLVDRPRSKQPPTKQKAGTRSVAPTPRPAARVADSPLPTANLGAAVRTHQLGNRVDAAVERQITAAVQHDLGNRIAPAVPPQERQLHPLAKSLRDPNGVRQAILLNEILQPPKALRH